MLDRLPLVLVVAAFLLHVVGERRAAARTERSRAERAGVRALSFYLGLLLILVALVGPLGALADKLFWVRMIQRLLLLTAAAPLIVLGRPWAAMWRAFPLRLQRTLAQPVARRSAAPIRAVARAVAGPAGAWLVFNVGLVFWHVPGPYDLALRNSSVHVLEYTSFLLAGVLFWGQVTALPPATSGLSYWGRIGYVASAMLTNVGLSIFLAFSQHPLYAPFAQLAHRPGGISALADQQIGAGIMWTAGDLPFAAAIALLAQRWLAENEAPASRLEAAVAGPLDGGQPSRPLPAPASRTDGAPPPTAGSSSDEGSGDSPSVARPNVAR